MDAEDLEPIDSEGDEVESSHLQLDSIPSDSQSKEVESIHLQLDSSSSEAQSVVGETLVNEDAQVVESLTHLHLDSSSSEAQSVAGEILLARDAHVVDNHASNSGQDSFDPQGAYQYDASIHLHLDSSSSEAQSVVDEVLHNGDAQVVDHHASNSGQRSFDPQVAYVGPSSSHPTIPFTYNGATYYSYEAFMQDFRRNLMQEMEMDGVAPRSEDDSDGPQFSDSMVFATGGSPAVINPHNGLPWRKGANLCRPYMDEGCCHFGTACLFHHPWPPTEEPL